MPRRTRDNSDSNSRRRKTPAGQPRARRGSGNFDSAASKSEKIVKKAPARASSGNSLRANKQDRKDASKDLATKKEPLADVKTSIQTNIEKEPQKSNAVPRKRASHAKKSAISSSFLKPADKQKKTEKPLTKSNSEDKKAKDAEEKAKFIAQRKASAKARKAENDKKRTSPASKADALRTQQKKNYVSKEIRNNFIKLGVMIIVGVGIVVGIYFGIQSIMEKQIGFVEVKAEEEVTPINTQVPRDRKQQDAAASYEDVTPDPAIIRDISYGSRDIQFKEKQINIPGIYDTELLFSAGTGSLYVGSDVLSKLYLYNLDTGDETLIAESKIYAGEYYETRVNHKWLVWLETDHGLKNYIMVMNRSTGKISKLQSFKEGQPKLNLYGDLLVWMEQVSDTEDRLSMLDLEVQEFLPIHTFSDKATYGVSSPYVYESTIVWADRDPTQTEDDKANGEKSAIYYLSLETDESGAFSDPQYYIPGTYVHEPLYNGDVFVWLDSNKSPMSNLYIGRPGEAPEIISTGVTTYSIGDGIVVYGKDQAVWVYIIATKELCRLTSPDEKGMLPSVTERTVVWYNLTADSEKDVLRFKILTDDELYPGGLD